MTRAAWNLRQPAYADEETFVENLRHVAEQLTRNTPVKTSFEITGTPRRLPASVEDNLLRVGQEAITNAVKHADARTHRVELNFEPHIVRLSVADDGRGFDAESRMNAADSDHFGLLGMSERAASMNGQLIVRSEMEDGTKVVVSVPIA